MPVAARFAAFGSAATRDAELLTTSPEITMLGDGR